jgi:hypothetical protein
MTDYYHIGDYDLTIWFESRSKDTGAYVDPTTVNITITASDGTVIVASTAMTNSSTGKYFYTWDLTGLAADDYRIEVLYDNGGDEGIRVTHIVLED